MPDSFSSLQRKSRPENHGQIFVESFKRNATDWSKWSPGNGSPFSWTISSRQDTLSDGHPWPPIAGDRMQDIGGAFRTISHHVSRQPFGPPVLLNEFPRFEIEGNKTSGQVKARGHLFPGINASTQFPDPVYSSESELMAWGTAAIASCKPTNSIADLSVTLAELYREGIPQLPGVSTWKDRTNIARGAGSEYLNTQFGWLPLVADVKNISKAIIDQEKIWRQYKRDAGRVVRRRFEFPDELSETTYAPVGYNYPLARPSNSVVSAPKPTRTRIVRTRRWFSGAFTYYLPDDKDRLDRFFLGAARARKLYGLTLDPEVLWNLAPWSWLSDWFFNTGDLISNVSDFLTDGLVMKYGYMMEETTVIDHYRQSPITSYGGGNFSADACLVTKTKQRIGASPYGFGLTLTDLSSRQLAILAALGITR